jgi:hypothetical protein
MRAPFKRSRLRDVGWTTWDPIGLLGRGDIWDHKPFGDEYDGYLLRVASMLRAGAAEEECIAYLDWESSEHMGLGPRTPAAQQASSETVEAIASYVRELDR